MADQSTCVALAPVRRINVGEIRCASCGTAKGSLKKCARCGQVTYCGTACQKKDLHLHKRWCRAAQVSRSCEKCKILAADLPREIIIDGSWTTIQPTDLDFHSFVVVFHFPTEQKVQLHGDAAAFAHSLLEAGADTIMFRDRICLPGIWQENFLIDKIHYKFLQRTNTCRGCQTSVYDDCCLICSKCKGPSCVDCISKMICGESSSFRCADCMTEVFI